MGINACVLNGCRSNILILIYPSVFLTGTDEKIHRFAIAGGFNILDLLWIVVARRVSTTAFDGSSPGGVWEERGTGLRRFITLAT